MTYLGTRPPLISETNLYELHHRARLAIKPGITGISKWKQEYADLKEQRDTDYTKLKATRAEVAELQKIRKCVDIALKAEQPEQTQSRTKRHDIDR